MIYGENVLEIVENFDVERVRLGAIRLLEKVGVKVLREDVAQRLLAKGFIKKGGRLLFHKKIVEDFLVPKPIKYQPKYPVKKVLGGSAFSYLDPEDGKMKPMDREHAVQYTKLADSYYEEKVLGRCPGEPNDAAPGIRQLESYYISCRYSRNAGGVFAAFNVPLALAYKEMVAVMGGKYCPGVNIMSPLVVGGPNFDVCLHFLDNGLADHIGGDSIPAFGVACPMDWYAAASQTVAEGVANILIFKALGAKGGSWYAHFYPADMRTGLVVLSTPESIIRILMEAKLNEYLGNPRWYANVMYCPSKVPDSQAATEKAICASLVIANGFDAVGSVGSLCGDEVWSPQQFILDMEMFSFLESSLLRKSVEPVSAENIVALVEEGTKSGDVFMGTETTSERFRDYCWLSKIYNRGPRGAWIKNPVDIRAAAWAEAKQRIATHDYELDKDKVKALEKIVASAKAGKFGKVTE